MIGRFSALSCSNIVNITSFYEGKAYYYVMLKDATKLSIDLVSTIDTDEHNGVEVKIPISKDKLYAFNNALYNLAFIPNVYIDNRIANDYDFSNYNDRKIYRYKTFGYCTFRDHTYYSSPKILIGNISYPIDTSKFYPFYRGDFEDFFKAVLPQFSIGELDITPNRENLIYTSETINKINKRLEEVKAEAIEIINGIYSKDYDDIFEYIFNNYYHERKYIPLGDETVCVRNIASKSTYNGINIDKYSELLSLFSAFISNRLFTVYIRKTGGTTERSRYNDSTFYSLISGEKPRRYRRTDAGMYGKDFKPMKFLVIPSGKGFSSKYLDGYLIETYGEDLNIVEDFTNNRSLSSLFKEFFGDTYYLNYHSNIYNKLLMYKLLVWLRHDIQKYIIVEDVMNTPSYAKYKKEHAEPKKVVTFSSEVIFYIQHIIDNCSDPYTMTETRRFNSIPELTKYLTQIYPNKIWLYSVGTDPYSSGTLAMASKSSGHGYGSKDYILISVAKSNSKVFKDIPKNYIPVDKVININNKNIRALYTFKKFAENNSDLYNTFCIQWSRAGALFRYTNDVQLPTRLNNLSNHMLRHCNTDPTLYNKFLSEGIDDQDVINDIKRFTSIVNVLTIMNDAFTYINGVNELFVYLCMKKKLIRINYPKYKLIKENIDFI